MSRKQTRPAAVITQSVGASPSESDGLSAVQQLERRRSEARRECEAARKELHSAETRVRELNAEIDKLTGQIDKLEPPLKTAEVIQSYLQSEQDLRTQRVQESGRRAPIDQALARNRSRGTSRPQFPAK